MSFINYLIVPFIMLFFGVIFRKHAPKDINAFYGYRTSMSTKNEDTWKFANEYMGRLWTKLGLIMLIISIAAIVIVYSFDNKFINTLDSILLLIQAVVLVASIFPIEKALRKNFDKNGNRKS
ncbi:MAG: SdpI family protein [Clostridium sp.]|nr:SdpI family protein [Clostridium sp.]